MTNAGERLPCPVCGSKMKKYGWRRRKVVEADGSTKVLLIRRLACPECGKYHHELSDMLMPYKRHCAATVEKIIAGNDDGVCCEESTIRRIRRWWQTVFLYFKSVCEALAAKYDIRFGDPLQPKEAVRAVANSHCYISTRSAYLSG